MTAAAFSDADPPSFRRAFEQWRTAFTRYSSAPAPLRCSPSSDPSSTPTWDQGAIMQQGIDSEGEKSDEQLKRERADCRRCEKWRDELARDSALPLPLVHSVLGQIHPDDRHTETHDRHRCPKVRSSDSSCSTSRSSRHLPPNPPPLRRQTIQPRISPSPSPAVPVPPPWPAATRPSWASSCARTAS